MKKKIVILLSILFILLLAGCSGEQDTQSTTTAEEVDTNLSGIELVKSLKLEIPENLIIEKETTGMEGMNSSSKTYSKGDNIRTEIESPEFGKQIMIYNAKEGKTYQYQDGQATGYVFMDSDADDDAIDEMMDSDLVPSYPDLLDDDEFENMTARNDVLDGEEVIYIETTESDEAGQYQVSMWLSKKYSTVLKYEMLQDGNLIMSSKVTHIEADTDIDDALFDPPATVQFVDVSMDTLFDGMEDLENIQ